MSEHKNRKSIAGDYCTFTAWLRAQRRRPDPVGDLARDAASDDTWPTSANSLPRLLAYLTARGATFAAKRDCYRAWLQFRTHCEQIRHGGNR